MLCTPQQVYDKLLNEDKILEKSGQINFKFSDVDIIVRQRDVVGNIIQEWLRGWFDKRGIEYTLSDNTQMPPDFFLDPNNLEINLLEVKAFNYEESPGFDIASFTMYQKEIVEKPYMLFVDYLIFGYRMDQETGTVTIENLWLKKVWEMIKPMKEWPITLQVKKTIVQKIRPCKWYGKNTDKSSFKIFENVEDFVSAIEETVYKNKDTREEASTWETRFIQNYKSYYGEDISIPRWYEIKDKYIVSKKKQINP